MLRTCLQRDQARRGTADGEEKQESGRKSMEPEQGDQKEQLGQEQGDEAASSASRGRLGHVEACAAGWPTLRPPARPAATPGPLPGRGISRCWAVPGSLCTSVPLSCLLTHLAHFPATTSSGAGTVVLIQDPRGRPQVPAGAQLRTLLGQGARQAHPLSARSFHCQRRNTISWSAGL